MTAWTRRSLLAAGSALGLSAACASLPASRRGTGGFAPETVAGLAAPAQDAVASGELSGAISLVWRRGDLVSLEIVGQRDLERGLPMERDALFGIASMSKPVTVAAALTLVEEGAIALDAPITEWAPEFADMRVLRQPTGPLDDTTPAPRPITIFDLMTHTSGIGYAPTTPGPLGGAMMAQLGFGLESPLTPDEWMATLAALPLASAPGQRFHYGHSIDVLGFVIARAAGMSLGEVMRAQLFDPLGMPDTGFWVPPGKRDRLAVAYSSGAPGEFGPAPIASWVGDAPTPYQSGGQGLVSTADDYLTFARMLVGGGEVDGRRVLTPETVALMTTDHLTPEQKIPGPSAPVWSVQGQGFGLAVNTAASGGGRVGAFGWGGAFGGWWQGDPAEDMVLLWLQHTLPAPPQPGQQLIPHLPGFAAARAFQTAAYAALDV
jgi:CubicO group peptidase (beta-lactamase class C family)